MRVRTFFMIIFMIIILFFSLPSIAHAISISCDPCLVNDCQCSITDCENGTLDVYTNSSCTGIPAYTFSFSLENKTWSPATADTYFLRVFCDDGNKSNCTSVGVETTPTTTTIPLGEWVSKPFLIIGIGIIIILIVASLVIIIKYAHWGTKQKTLIVKTIAIILISLLISSLPVQERKGVKELSVWDRLSKSIRDLFSGLWEWIVPPPREAVYYPPSFLISAQILDSNHNPTIYVPPGQRYYVSANVTNVGQGAKSVKFIVQIKDSIGRVVDDINSSTLQLDPGQTERLEVSYTASDVMGNYIAQIFVWTDWASRRGFALAPSLDLSFSVEEITTTTTTPTTTTIPTTSTTPTTTTIPTTINEEHILNYLDYNLNRGNEIGLFNLHFTLDSYDILEEPIPYKTEVIEYLNGLQSDEGTWATGQGHYVPVTASVLMFYNRSGVIPPKSLDPFFSTVDTWDKVNTHVNTYDPTNYWGGLWGYISCYVVYNHERPPWTDEYLNAVNTRFDDWAYSNHQRTHVIMNLFQLNESVPRVNEVVNIALQQQREDGSWDHHTPETAFMIGALGLIRDQTTVDQNLIDSAISDGLNFIESCYKTYEHEGEIHAGFAANPSEQYPNPWATALGIYSLLNPESDVWTRWIVTTSKIDKTELDNTLEYYRKNYLSTPHDAAMYVMLKSWLQLPIENKTEIIDYFNSKQGQDGAWSDSMFVTHRVLMAYFCLDATPQKSLDGYFENYDTISELYDYVQTTGSKDARDIYHVLYGWALWHFTYPPWVPEIFPLIEQDDLTWTWKPEDIHKRTHILYSYVLARYRFPELDSIITATLQTQEPDGSWYIGWGAPEYSVGIQLMLLKSIRMLYPDTRGGEIESAIEKSTDWVYGRYKTKVVEGKTYGYFGEWGSLGGSGNVWLGGVMSAIFTGLVEDDADSLLDPLFDKLYEKIINQGNNSNSWIMQESSFQDEVSKNFNVEHWLVFLTMHTPDNLHNLSVAGWIGSGGGTNSVVMLKMDGSTYSVDFSGTQFQSVNNEPHNVTVARGDVEFVVYPNEVRVMIVHTEYGIFNFTMVSRGLPLWMARNENEMIICSKDHVTGYPYYQGGFGDMVTVSGTVQDKDFEGYGLYVHWWTNEFIMQDWACLFVNQEDFYYMMWQAWNQTNPDMKYLSTGFLGFPEKNQYYSFDDFTFSFAGVDPITHEPRYRIIGSYEKGNLNIDGQKIGQLMYGPETGIHIQWDGTLTFNEEVITVDAEGSGEIAD